MYFYSLLHPSNTPLSMVEDLEWDIPPSDDEMEYDMWKCVDAKLIGYFDILKLV